MLILPYQRQQRGKRFLRIGAKREVDGVVLAELPVALAHVQHRHARRQRIDRAVDRHAQQVGAEYEQQVEGLERGAHRLLVARERAQVRRVLAGKRRAVGHGLAEHACAEERGELRRLAERVALGELLSGEDRGIARGQQPRGEPRERFVGGARARIHAGAAAEIHFGFGFQHVARQRDKYRAGGRRRRDLGRAPQHQRQVLGARHLDRPFDERLRERHERRVEQRLAKAVPLLLLPRGDDDRRAGEFRVEERAHRVAEPRRDVDVRRREAPGGAREAVGHADHHRLVKPEDESQLRVVRHRFHDRKLGRAGIAEEVGHPLVLEDAQERAPARELHRGRVMRGASARPRRRQRPGAAGARGACP